MNPQDSVVRWMEDLQDGQSTAAQEIFDQYYHRLVGLARNKLDDRLRRVENEEDVASSVIKSLCQRAGKGDFSGLQNRDELWCLLVTMTARKAASRGRRHRAQKRGRGEVRGESVVMKGGDGSMTDVGFDCFLHASPTPDDLLILQETFDELVTQVDDPTLKKVVFLKFEGFTNREIGEQLRLTERSIERKLQRIRKAWESSLAASL